MTDTNRSPWLDASVFTLLVAIGVVGRWDQPVWAFTPIAATALLAGAWFPRRVAVLVPIAALLLSDLWLPGHNSFGVMLTVYASMAVPALLGRWLFSANRTATRVGRLAACGVAPATLFFAATNLAVWWFRSDYPHDAGGLIACYANALPFYRQMLAGDLLYVTMICGAVMAAGVAMPTVGHRQAAAATIR